jgi:putative exosortase-associated protein (TIGR04073 family)
MKKFVILATAAILVVSISCLSFAYETDFDDLHRFDRNLPAWKLGRGIVNVLGAPQELLACMTNNAIDGERWGAYDEGMFGSLAGALNGHLAGIFPGVTRMLKRAGTGLLEIATFWKPEYGPTMEPTYGTRCYAWGYQDYFSAHPFWYMGPGDN